MTIHRKHLRHNKLDRNRRGAFADFLASEADSKSMPERAIRDCFEDITVPGLTAAQIDAAANAGAAGVVTESLTLTLAQKAAVSPTSLSFGELIPGSQARSLKFGATTGAITVDFNATANTITRASGSFVTDGFVVGGTLAISGAADAANNSATPVITDVSALVLTVDDIPADEVGDADVTISCLDTIKDADGVSLELIAGFVVGADIVITNTDAHNVTREIESINAAGDGAVLTTPFATIASDTTASIRVASGDVSLGILFDAADAEDTLTFDRSAGTIVSADDSDFDDLGFVVGGKIRVSASLNNNGLYTIRAVTTDTLTVARATTGSITVTFAAGERGTITRGSGSFLTDGFKHGDRIVISGAADAANNAEFEVIGVTALVMYVRDLPASESNDSGVTISTADLTDEESELCKIVQVNSISGLPLGNLAAGSVFNFLGLEEWTGDSGFSYEVGSITGSTILLADGQPEMPGVVEDSGSVSIFHSNVIVRAAGDWENDGFEAGETITIAGADADNVDGEYVVRSTNNTILFVEPLGDMDVYYGSAFRTPVVRDTNATVKGRAKITRSAGDWATNGFAVDKLLYLQDTKGVTTGNVACDFVAEDKTITRASGSFITDGFAVGDQITIANAVDAENAGPFTILAINGAGDELTVEETIADEAADTVAITQYRANDGYYRIKKVVSATVIEVQDTISPETSTASVDAILINEKAR